MDEKIILKYLKSSLKELKDQRKSALKHKDYCGIVFISGAIEFCEDEINVKEAEIREKKFLGLPI